MSAGKGYEDRTEPLPDLSIKRPIPDEVDFQKEEHFAFSPMPQNVFTVENIGFILLVVKLSKTPEGIKTLERIALKYLDSCTKIISSIQESCSGNWLTALNNQHITVGMTHRIGLLDDGAYIKIFEHYRAVFDKMWEKSFITDTVGSVTTLVQGSKAGGSTGVGALATMLKALK